MENLLQGLPGVVVYIDDILIAGTTKEEHLQRLSEVLQRLEQAEEHVAVNTGSWFRQLRFWDTL